LTSRLSGHYGAALAATLIFTLIPENLLWFSTTAVEPSASLFAGLTILAALLFVCQRDRKALFLLAVVLPFSVQFRPESFLLIPLILLGLALYAPETFKRHDFYAASALTFLLLSPHLMHLYAVSDEPWGSPGPKFSMIYFWANFRDNARFYLDNARFPLAWTLLALAGLLLGKNRQAHLLLGMWFLGFWGIFLFFYAGSYNYGTDVRFSLVSYMPLAVLAGTGVARLATSFRGWGRIPSLKGLILAALLLVFLPFLPSIRAEGQEAWAARADHRFAQEMLKVLPADSLVLTHNPNMFLLWGRSAAQASIATYNRPYLESLFARYEGGIYFHYNAWCNYPDPVQNAFCTNILNGFKTVLVTGFQEKTYHYVLYKIEPPGR
jgi:hypothetical protein